MYVEIRCFGSLREHLSDPGAGRMTVEIDDTVTVREVIARIDIAEDQVVSVLVDGARASLEQVVHEGAEITLMPPFAGGSC